MNPIEEVLTDGLTAIVFFGSNTKRARLKYRRYLRLVHPDLHHDDPKAEDATIRLNDLWDDYQSASTASTGRGKPKSTTSRRSMRRVAHDDVTSLFVDDPAQQWVSVMNTASERRPSADEHIIMDMTDRSEGSPVTIIPFLSASAVHEAIMQSDGPHDAMRADGAPVDVLYTAKDLLSMPSIDERDVAWIYKRAIFMGGLMDMAGGQCSQPLSHLIINPRTHDAFIDPTAITARTKGSMMTAMVNDVPAGVLDGSSRLSKWIHGGQYTDGRHTGELLHEYDNLLASLFGAPSFHVMTMPAS
jgi:hypothetical protein